MHKANGIVPIDDNHEVYITWAEGSLDDECWALLCDGHGGRQVGRYFPGKVARFAPIVSQIGFFEDDRRLGEPFRLKPKAGGVFRITQIGTWLVPREERKSASKGRTT